MNTKTTLPVTEARKKIFQIMNEVQKPGVHYILTDKGHPKAVIISAEEFESLIETIEVMQDFPDLEKDIKEAEKNLAKGNYVTLEEILTKEGFILADKGKKQYGVPGCRAKKTAKRIR